MHDPKTVAFQIPYPWRAYGRRGRNDWERNYRAPFITIWHVDPEADASDDSCGWFKRARHGEPGVLEAIKQAFAFDWDADYGGWFDKAGKPLFSTSGIVLGMFWHAAFAHFGKNRNKTNRFMQRHLFDILHFAENPTDSLHPSIVGKYGIEPREDRISQAAAIVYGCVLRWDQKPWQHARWHIWHWKLQVHPLQKLHRRLFVRCSKCGKPFGWNESPIGSWGGDDVWHSNCDHTHVVQQGAQGERAA